MAYSEADLGALTARLGDAPGLSERKMFGAHCVMLDGNMLRGVREGGAMVRVGKPNMTEALEGVEPVEMGGGRKMADFLQVRSAALAEDAVMAPLLDFAFRFSRTLPRK